ncbi:MAG: hypothetical protein Q9226_009243 [Calogaya cf. arnoldii]
MAYDVQLVVLAGEGTSAYTLTATLLELLSHPKDLAKVEGELAAAMPNKNQMPSYSAIEALRHFNAAIQESLRLHPGVMSRIPRISPEASIVYKDKGRGRTFVLPPGTVTSMSTFITHTNPDIF